MLLSTAGAEHSGRSSHLLAKSSIILYINLQSQAFSCIHQQTFISDATRPKLQIKDEDS